MKDMGIVRGSKAQAKPLVIGKDTVYVHTDIEKIEYDTMGEPTDNLYQYHEVQYEKDEYIKKMSNETDDNQAKIDYLAMMTDVELEV